MIRLACFLAGIVVGLLLLTIASNAVGSAVFGPRESLVFILASGAAGAWIFPAWYTESRRSKRRR